MQNTKARVRALEFFQSNAMEGSQEDYRFKSGEYSFSQDKREKYTTQGNLDISGLYESLGIEEQVFTLIKRILQLNLTTEEVHNIIKFCFRKLYHEGGRTGLFLVQVIRTGVQCLNLKRIENLLKN